MAEVIDFPRRARQTRPVEPCPTSMGDEPDAPVSDELSRRADEESRACWLRVSAAIWGFGAGILGWWWLVFIFALMFLFAQSLTKED